ncbi:MULTISPECIES: FAD-dependent oxidoreductase [unclassified Ensifer]|uniref:FAD-dependent oxidoreductase n=1 Tax=unclassified Ensifer TaxID=2633371 RepID=UPI00300FAD65
MSSSILIVGAGIAGLTAALALQARGFADVAILERAAAFGDSGSGLNVLPPAVRELDRLGLLDMLLRGSVQLDRLEYSTQRGQLIWSEKRGCAAGFRWPQLSVSRSTLHQGLFERVTSVLGSASVIMASAVQSIDRRADGSLSVTCPDGRAFGADLVIGADGIRSAVRSAVEPDFAGLQLAPVTIYRGNCWHPTFRDDDRTMIIAGDGRSKFVVYPMLPRQRYGNSLINWAAAIPDDATSPHPLGRWNVSVSSSEIAKEFAGWTLDGVSPSALIEATGRTYAYPMVDIDPLARWSNGSDIVLVGDAAHAMYPVGSNGATQSIIDAVALAHFLSIENGIRHALAAYERDRRPRVSQIQLSNRHKGPEIVVDIAAERAPYGFGSIADVFPGTELTDIANRYAALAGMEREQANAPSPYGASIPHKS